MRQKRILEILWFVAIVLSFGEIVRGTDTDKLTVR
jgi:hypothetical protein